MVDLETLATRARRTAERSRARMACQVAAVVAPLALVPLVGGAALMTCACLAVALFAVAALLRWRNQVGVDSVRDGLVLGAIPLAAALVLRSCNAAGSSLDTLGPGELACLLAGAAAGLGVTWRAARSPTPRRRWLSTLLVASLTAALGCTSLGLAGALAALLALPLVAAVAWLPITLRAT